MSHNRGEATNTNPASRSRTSHVKTHRLSSQAGCGIGDVERAVDLAGEITLEASADHFGSAAFSGPFLDVGAGGGVEGHAGDCCDVAVELGHPLGQADRLGAGDREPDLFVTGAPARSLGDLLGGQRSASVDAKVDHTHQRDQRVEGRGALGGHVVTGSDQDPQRGPLTVVMAGMAQFLDANGFLPKGAMVLSLRAGADLGGSHFGAAL
jgi:hypothetical protein